MTDILQKLSQLLGDNQFFRGGLLLGIFGGVVYYLKGLGNELWILFKRKIIAQLYIHDDIVTMRHAIFIWLEKNNYIKKSRALALGYMRHRAGSTANSIEHYNNLQFKLAPGKHYIWYKWHPFCIEVIRKDKLNSSNEKSYIDEIVISCLFGGQKLIKQLIHEAYTAEKLNAQGDHIVARIMDDSGYCCDYNIQQRPMESVYIDLQIKTDIINDMSCFLKNQEQYTRIGIPYHRGYLLYGPAGSGKTSLIWALASLFKKEIVVANIQALAEGTIDQYSNAFFVIEDIDHLIDFAAKNNKFNLSKLLNSMDGFAAPQGTVIFMTTNNIEKLDEAMLRDGRIDKKYFIGPPSEAQIQEMINRFGLQNRISADDMADQPNMAAIQNKLLKLIN